MPINSAADWCWFARDLEIAYGEDIQKAYLFLSSDLIPRIQAANIPHEFICDGRHTHLVLPKDYLMPATKDLIIAAGFVERPMPEHNQEASAEFKEALLKGSDFNKKWH